MNKYRFALSMAALARWLGLSGVARHCETKAQTFKAQTFTKGVEPRDPAEHPNDNVHHTD